MDATTAQLTPSQALRLPKFELPIALTMRGLLFLLFFLALLLGPAYQTNDIISSTLGWTFFAILAPLALGTIVQGSRIKPRLLSSLSILPVGPETESRIVSNLPANVLLEISKLSIIPLHFLEVELTFEQPGVADIKLIFTGQSNQRRLGQVQIKFPHRGLWRIQRTRASVCDIFGLTKYSWNLPGSSYPLKVYPQKIASLDIPVITSCNRPGDQISDLKERSGDPLDLKPYHPSDGMRRILWKVYAKSGDLVSRHPERSISPEGQVLLFPLAKKQDDDVASAAVSYAKRLIDMGLDVYSSCEGAVQISPSRDDAELENLLVDSVWASDKHIDTALASLHSLISESERGLPGSSVSKVIIFASAMRADSAPGLALLEAVGKSLSARNISPIFVVLQQPWSMQTSQSQNSIALKLSNYLLYPEHSAATKAESAKALGFANVCRDRDWEVILVRH